LRDARAARRRQGGDGRQPHRHEPAHVQQLGCGQRAGRRAAGGDAAHSVVRRAAGAAAPRLARRRTMKPASDTQITHARRAWLYVLGVLIMIFLLAPTLIVIPMSFSDSAYLQFPPDVWSLRWYESYINSVEWTDATLVSLKAALLTVVLATPLGTAAAYGLHVSQGRLATAILTEIGRASC